MNRSVAPAALATALLLALSACIPAQPETTASPSPSTTPDTSATAEPAAWPESRVDLTCDDLASADVVAAALAGSEQPAQDLMETEFSAYPGIPRAATIHLTGGLVCEWANGVPFSDYLGNPPDYIGVRATVLAGASDEGWDQASYQEGSQCYLMCTTDLRLGDYWLTLQTYGAGESDGAVLPAVGALIDSMIAAIESLPPAPALVAAPASLPADCDAYIDTATVQELLGASEILLLGEHGGGWSAWAEAGVMIGRTACSWTGADDRLGASLTALPGGAELALALRADTATDVALGSSTVRAWRTTSDVAGTEYEFLDLVLDGGWIQIRVAPEVPLSVAPSDATRTIAERVIENLGSN